MCEASVYLVRQGQEELLMEKVDRIIPGEDGSIFMESIFGERKVVQGRIREMELVHHRVVLEEISNALPSGRTEIWMEPATEHGHFHAGEEVRIRLLSGYNMKAGENQDQQGLKAWIHNENGEKTELSLHPHHGGMEINLGQEADGLLQIYAEQQGDKRLYAKLLMEIGHHHHHHVAPIGLPLEIVPVHYSHARMGESYEVQLLKNGEALAGAEIRVTYASTRSSDYPHRLVTDANGKARVFLTARGNYLFTAEDEENICSFTLVKGF